ncbi:hypothetical protein [Alicyclobacillus macrosporangiidus]|uniref:Uncharacterized protein n=1 Tax=Alicyclobacillus macrosporangiidus TaxID=392015 RepID=A0A1I7FPM0_9BACL|nr:hypothetical protein [Alicyclobacillus macrosporangiidus]SFU38088.1 hypothetical protein SAMN05421543_101379 [Alicyclobacillus macrosporangiidus]
MNTAHVSVAFTALTLLVNGCGLSPQSPEPGATTPPPDARHFTFLSHLSQNPAVHSVPLVLKPDPDVLQHFPPSDHIQPPKDVVTVYLPVYPHAQPVNPVPGIGDDGTPLDADLVDGVLYFQSQDSEDEILGWYTQQLEQLGYHQDGRGETGQNGKPLSYFYDFTDVNAAPGNPTQAPDIQLGFAPDEGQGITRFKLKVLFIVTPERPRDTYLPDDIVRVVLTYGSTTRTVTDKTWIQRIVTLFNALQVSTPGISAGGAMAAGGPPKPVEAKFYAQDGSVTTVTFTFPAGVRIGDVSLSGTAELTKAIQSVITP